LLGIGAAFFSEGWSLLLFLAYPLQILRLTLSGASTFKVNFLRAFFLVIGKFPEVQGQMSFHYHRFLKRQASLIEYKGSE
jgi:hypothetical protein